MEIDSSVIYGVLVDFSRLEILQSQITARFLKWALISEGINFRKFLDLHHVGGPTR